MPITIFNDKIFRQEHSAKAFQINPAIYSKLLDNILALLKWKPSGISGSDILKSEVAFEAAKGQKDILDSCSGIFRELNFDFFIFLLDEYLISLIDIFIVDIPLFEESHHLLIDAWVGGEDEFLKGDSAGEISIYDRECTYRSIWREYRVVVWGRFCFRRFWRITWVGFITGCWINCWSTKLCWKSQFWCTPCRRGTPRWRVSFWGLVWLVSCWSACGMLGSRFFVACFVMRSIAIWLIWGLWVWLCWAESNCYATLYPLALFIVTFDTLCCWTLSRQKTLYYNFHCILSCYPSPTTSSCYTTCS